MFRFFVGFVALQCIWSCQGAKVSLKYNTNNGNLMYNVLVDTMPWLENLGTLDAYLNNEWHATNSTKVDFARSNSKLAAMYKGTLVQKGTRVVKNLVDDFGGKYNGVMVDWQAISSKGQTVPFVTEFRIYEDSGALGFVQTFPEGASGTAAMPAPIPRGVDDDTDQVPFLSFPRFSSTQGAYGMKQLGFLTWTRTFSQPRYGRAPLNAGDLGGRAGGPVVLYDSNATSVVVSPITHFTSATQQNNHPQSSAASLLYSANRKDTILCVSSQCYQANTGYEVLDLEGTASLTPTNDTIPLTLYFSGKYLDNYITTDANPPDSSYNIKFSNGYLFKTPAPGRLRVDMYYSASRQDHATIASAAQKTAYQKLGYVFVKTQGYLEAASGPTNKDWMLGASSQILSVPPGFSHETVVVVGDGISDAMMTQFGGRIQSMYKTKKTTNDLITTHLGYWTDDGAYYYGDSWHATQSMNLTCCSQKKLLEVKAGLEKNDVPIQYLQMDDWWYIGNYPGKYWGGVKAVSHWEPPEPYYPGGLRNLTKTMGLPLLLYGPYFAPQNDWSGDFEFIPQGAGYVLPTPEQSEAFYSAVFDFGLDGRGMFAYEVDFMSGLSGTPYFRTHLDGEAQWLAGMHAAAKKRGLTIQYCMAQPHTLMASLPFSQVTNGRASGDYAFGGNYAVGAGSILWHSLGLHPSKDNLWTYTNEPQEPGSHAAGNDHGSTQTHTMAATLSTGPVGISDRAGYTNATLAKQTCRADGRLLQPNRPATAIDDQFLFAAFKGDSHRQIWQTVAGPPGMDDRTIFLATDEHSQPSQYKVTYKSSYPALDPSKSYVVRSFRDRKCVNGKDGIASRCVKIVPPNSAMVYQFKNIPPLPYNNHYSELVTITPLMIGGSTFLGELNKFVGVSKFRFTNYVNTNGQQSVDVVGRVGETVEITVMDSTKTITVTNVVIPAAGKKTFTF